MKNKRCQSCGMPITSNEQLGINKDGSINNDYCQYCFESGEFIDKISMEDYIDKCSEYGDQVGMTKEEMKEYCKNLFSYFKKMEMHLYP